jgi:hypothetical protein
MAFFSMAGSADGVYVELQRSGVNSADAGNA